MRTLLRLLALGAALILTWLGCGTPQESTWRVYMAGIVLALLLALWPGRSDEEESSLGHNARRMGALLLVIATLLGLQMLRLQVVRSAEVSEQVAELPEGSVENVRPFIAERKTRRGRIFDREGVVLADIEITAGEWVRRVYPGDDLGHIVGFYNPRYDNAGLEATFDRYLAGRVQEDSFDAFIEDLAHRPHLGVDLHLTLDMALQEAAQQALGENTGAAVVLDPRTGEVLAMVTSPRFDPRPMVFDPTAEDWDAEQARIADYWETLRTSPDAPLLNRATSGLYPPGSTFKTVTAAAVIESGVADPETRLPCPDELVVTGHTIVNFMEGLADFMEKENLREAYQYSCNTAFAQLGLMLGEERFSEYSKRFGLMYPALAPLQSPDFTDLPAAVSVIAHDRSFLERDTGMADSAFGQGELQVTPLQMAVVAATIANDGILMRPYLVDRAVDPSGEVLYQAQPTPLRVPIGVRTSRTMRQLMVAAVEEGWGWRAKVEGVTVAGKTGTAETGSGEPHAWFIAFAPAEQARFAVAVIVEHGDSGAIVAAPIAGEILAAALQP
jgi:peptidoglycan glycosyltransferase